MNAVDYNAAHARFFAPTGYPLWTGIKGWGSDPQDVRTLQDELGLTKDGKLGRDTTNAIAREDARRQGGGCLLIGARGIPVTHPVVTWHEMPRLAKVRMKPRVPSRRLHAYLTVVHHWDVTFGCVETPGRAPSTLDVLIGKAGTHIMIDGDDEATIYQTCNPTTHYTMNAGKDAKGRSANSMTVGVDLNSPVLMRHQKRDLRWRGRERPVVEGVVNGKAYTSLGFFEEQLHAHREVMAAISRETGIELTTPVGSDGGDLLVTIEDAALGGGHVHHLQVAKKRRKYDTYTALLSGQIRLIHEEGLA